MKKLLLFSVSILLGCTYEIAAQVNVDINFDMRHTVGGVDSFDRNKFIVLHADATETDYNEEIGKLDSLINLYDAYYGRETGRMRFTASQVTEDPNRPGFADPNSIAEWGGILNDQYGLNTPKHQFESKGTTINAAQVIPFYPNGNNVVNANNPWFFSTKDDGDEPFGAALGQFTGLFLQELYGSGGTDGPPKPSFVEVMNEPVWPLVDFDLYGGGNIDDIFKMHLTVADSVRKYSPESKVGGFCTAFPDLEKFGNQAGNNQLFGQWEERWKRFIDEVGPSMDFYSIHLYDFPSIGGKEQLRKGSNIEATMDMIEHYNTIKYGEVKPWVISEYGSQLNDFFSENWSPGRDWLIIKAFSSMMMQFMERPHTIQKTVPFVLGRADFLFGNPSAGFPYPWRMMRRQNEPSSYTGDWVFSDVVKFYQLWSDVNGTRVDTKSSDPDLMVDAYINQSTNKGYLVLNNIDEFDLEVNLNQFGLGNTNIASVKIKHLSLDANNVPQLEETLFNESPSSVLVGEEGCMIIEYSFDTPLVINESSEEEKIYATTYKQEIIENQAVKFSIPNVSLGNFGEAVLRIGIGRELAANRKPEVKINGNVIEVPSDYRGDIQQQRNIFFGALEIPIPYANLVEGTNEIEITFGDSGGFISSCALQTFNFSRSVIRSGIPDRDRAITFVNKASFIADGESIPTLFKGQTIPAEIKYSTGINDGTEEDLFYIAMQVQQVDENFGVVNTSSFQAVVNDSSPNASELTIDYNIPSTFDNGDSIPLSSALPDGHKLFLLIFMSVDNDAGFANDNTEINLATLPDRERSINFKNKDDYIPEGGTIPTFVSGETFPVEIDYSTGRENGAEEDLFYIAMMVRQIDGDLNEVKTSNFQVVIPGTASNEDLATIDYILPTSFSDGTPIPVTEELPEGHSLLLLMFMSVDSDAGFADDNMPIIINKDTDSRERQITFVNKDEFVPANQTLPTFAPGQQFSTTLDYSTGLVNGIEEDLFYVAMMVRQVDESFGIVKTSNFQSVISGDAPNVGQTNIDYTLPTVFDDGTEIPTTNDLPTGHKLLLLVFMSVNEDVAFADDNTEIIVKELSPPRERKVKFVNKEDFIPEGAILPLIKSGQNINVQLDYSTGVIDNIEENLFYVAMQVRQVDESFNVINTSAFQVVIPGEAPNADLVNIDYQVPTTFADGSIIPISNELPDGHQLLLLIFMSVDQDAGFADDNTAVNIMSFIPDRQRTISFDNIEDFIPDGGNLPQFDRGQTFPVSLSYHTGVSNCIEEDLSYVAMQVREIDDNFNIVNSSQFEVIAGDSAVNADSIQFDYTLPRNYEDGTRIPKSALLTEGHQLLLLIFMSVNNDSAFANANTAIVIGQTGRRSNTARNQGIQHEVKSDKVLLFPNPASEKLTVFIPYYTPEIIINIQDQFGKTLSKSKVSTQQPYITIPTNYLKSGSYIISIVGKDKVEKKIFFKR